MLYIFLTLFAAAIVALDQWTKALAAVAGSVIYRFIIALALRANVPSECLKLISAVIVALAIAAPALRDKAALNRRRVKNSKEDARHA